MEISKFTVREEIIREAVYSYAHSLSFAKIQSEEICLYAVKASGSTIQYIIDPTEEMLMIAVTGWPRALKYANIQTEKMCLRAVEQDCSTLRYVKDQTEEMCLRAVRNGSNMKYIRNQTEEMVFVKTQASRPPPALSSCEETRCFDGS